MREVLEILSDGSEFTEFKAGYGTTRWSPLSPACTGHPVGFVANNGVLFSESALKGRTSSSCATAAGSRWSSCRTSPDSWSGAPTRGGIAKNGAKMVTAVACARVPKLTVMIGGSFGAGNYSMCGRAYSPRFLWSWPNARISVMGGPPGGRHPGHRAPGPVRALGPDGWPADEEAAFKAPIHEQFARQSDAYYSTARLGTTASSTPRTRARCSAWPWRPAAMRPRTGQQRRLPDVRRRLNRSTASSSPTAAKSRAA